MAITLSYGDAVKLCKQFKGNEILNLDTYYENSLILKEQEKMLKKIESLSKKIARLENQKCLYKNKDVSYTKKKKEKYISHAERVLMECGFSDKEKSRIYSKYGEYAGAYNYGLRHLGRPIAEPVYQCDDERKKILKEYARIRDNEGIKEANKYFLKADKELRIKEGKL